MAGIFLTGEWRYLAMLNYQVAPELLAPYVPRGTALDTWRGRTYVSVVGFLFCDTRVLGIPVPFHRTFEEVNLRLYVCRDIGGEVRRGVTFIRELVPRRAVATVARWMYNEPYVALPMRHRIDAGTVQGHAPKEVRYEWRQNADWGGLAVSPTGMAAPVLAGSEAEFITEHYWGYTRQRNGGTVEYQVTHPRWRTWDVTRATLNANLEALYGWELAAVLSRAPDSAFLADGSAIAVHRPRRLAEGAR